MPPLRDVQISRAAFLQLAEAGLVLLLFTDASRTDLKFLKSIRKLPTRLLSTGMLLTILLGGLAALVCFRKFTIWEAGILAAILAPTDAGLGQIIVTNERVPMRIRQALNVEAGLNDGLSVPFLLFFMALSGAAGEEHSSRLAHFMLEQLGYGTLIGIGVGLLGGWLLYLAQRKNWIAASWLQLGVVTLPLLCAIISEHAAASMFIAAFVAGLAVQVGFEEAGQHSLEFTEDWGQLLNLSVFFIFGALVARNSRSRTCFTRCSASRWYACCRSPSRSSARASAAPPCCSWAGSARAVSRRSCWRWFTSKKRTKTSRRTFA
jgi:NhaP-type Na+/H+ or K+/H+ antiporter